jgi:beta-lactamase regulating signal transducer with metallopeptidase domain
MISAFPIISFLLQQSLYAACVGGFVWLILFLVRPKHPAWIVGLWSLVLVRLVVPIDLAVPWSARAGIEFGIEYLSAGMILSEMPSVSDIFLQFIFILWGCGVFVGLGLMWRAHKRALALIAMAQDCKDNFYLALVQHWRLRLNMRRAVRLVIGEATISPFTLGVLRPIIYLPSSIAQSLEPDEASAIIGHEMAHVKAGDALWLIVEHLLQALFFFNPLVRIAIARIADAREALRDLQVIRAGNISAPFYLSALLRVLKLHQDQKSDFILAVSLGKSAQRLKSRLLTVKNNAPHKAPSRMMMGFALCAALLFILPMARYAPPVQIAPPKQNAHFLAQLPTPRDVSALPKLNASKIDLAALKASDINSCHDENETHNYAMADQDVTLITQPAPMMVQVAVTYTAITLPDLLAQLHAKRDALVADLQAAEIPDTKITELLVDFDATLAAFEALQSKPEIAS